MKAKLTNPRFQASPILCTVSHRAGGMQVGEVLIVHVFLYYGTYDYYNSDYVFPSSEPKFLKRQRPYHPNLFFYPNTWRSFLNSCLNKGSYGWVVVVFFKQFLNCLDTSEKRKKRTDNEITFATYQPTGFVTHSNNCSVPPCRFLCIF